MDYIGIAFLIVIIILAISGFAKGFLSNLIDSTKKIAGLVLGFVFCKKIGGYVLNSSIGDKIITKFHDVLINMNGAFGIVVTETNKDVICDEVWKYVPLPGNLNSGLKELTNSYIEEGLGSEIGFYVAKAMGFYISILIGFILILLASSLIFMFLSAIAKTIDSKKGFMSRLGGLLIGVLKGLIFAWVCCYVINIVYSFIPDTGVGKIISDCLNSDLGIYRFINEHNLISTLLEEFVFNS